MRTTNPVLNEKALAGTQGLAGGAAMTVQGAVNQTLLLLAVLLVASSWTWGRAVSGGPVQDLVLLGALGGFITALVTIFKKPWAPVTAPIYAAFEGLALGGISAVMEVAYRGIVMNAVALTFGTMGALLLAYKSGLIKVTDKFRLGVFAATGGIALVYLTSFVLGFFGVRMPFLYDSSPLSIGISVVVVIVAALNLVLDFDFIERGAESRQPKYMEAYAAFGLMVTLVWLYLEILRLLAKTRRR